MWKLHKEKWIFPIFFDWLLFIPGPRPLSDFPSGHSNRKQKYINFMIFKNTGQYKHDWMIGCLEFYAVSAVFQSPNGGRVGRCWHNIFFLSLKGLSYIYSAIVVGVSPILDVVSPGFLVLRPVHRFLLVCIKQHLDIIIMKFYVVASPLSSGCTCIFPSTSLFISVEMGAFFM